MASPSRIWTHVRADSLRATSRRCGASSHNPAGRAPSPARGPRDGIRPTSPRSSVAALWAARRRASSRICSMRPPLMLRRPFGRLRGRSGHHSQAGRANAPGSRAMFALAGAAGFAEGVLNLVYASEGDVIGRELCSNPKVRKISFTGSTEVGRLLMRQCSDQIRADQLRALRQRSLHRLR